MSEYKLTWEIDLDADTPREAAEKAVETFRDQVYGIAGALPPVFSVLDVAIGIRSTVDLSQPDRFLLKDWQYEVANGDTLLGYAEWVKHQTEAEEN